jgi:hypothetical protein
MFEDDNKDQTRYVYDDELSGSFSRDTNSTGEPRNVLEAGRDRGHTAAVPTPTAAAPSPYRCGPEPFEPYGQQQSWRDRSK